MRKIFKISQFLKIIHKNRVCYHTQGKKSDYFSDSESVAYEKEELEQESLDVEEVVEGAR